jgi:outer membrane receptor protein involved in Fe transport
LQAAWRVELYSDFGFADNPKFGVKYSPEEHVLLRATYQTAFRAPSLQQLYMGKGVSFQSLIDPKRGDVGMQYKTIASGNQNLQPEEADSFSVGTVFDIPMPDDMSLSVSVNWSQIELDDQIASFGAQYMLSNEELFKDNIERDGQDNVEHINISFLNLAEVQTEAVDLQINYSIDTSIGHLGADLAAAYQYQYDYKARPSDSFVDLSGSYNRPEWRGHMGLWWTYDKYSAGATVNYVDSFDQLYGVVSKVDEHTTLDLQASYNLTDNFRLTVGARNVTDEDPPWSDSESQGYSFAAAGHSPLGTILYGRITIRF